MLSWAITFLVVGLIAALLGVSGVAGTATLSPMCCLSFSSLLPSSVSSWASGR